ncbi:folliculin-interacting protein middle domain-containing protein [Sporodiniella umbellata]|nr:folliculin-interacting protein middle domain-containing protein [Sporodiniella umbellata]
MRVILCQDGGDANKTVLYDSDHPTHPCTSTAPMAHSWNDNRIKSGSRQPAYRRTMTSLSDHRHNNRKLNLTGEMIFGTAPLAYKGMNTKIHYYKRDKHPQIIVSKLFMLNNSNSQRRASFSSISSDFSSLYFEDAISESDEDGHLYYPPILGLHIKRNRRFSQTNLETVFHPTPLPTTPTKSIISNCRMKYAVALIITLPDNNQTLYDFVFSHFALIENRLHQLQAVALKQLYQQFRPLQKKRNLFYLYPDTFQQDPLLVEAVSQFKQSFFDLYTTPRIQEPLWLNMSTFPHRKQAYQESLMKELIALLHQFNDKSHSYFISTLLTAVLTHHLSWVYTVAPPNTHIPVHQGDYDPLWAQLSDLYGFVGTPSRITRTIVTGLQPSLVRRILYILTYFIRCNEVYETTEDRCPTEDSIFSQEVPKTTFFEKTAHDLSHLADIESIAIPHSHPKEEKPLCSFESNSTLNRYDSVEWSPELSCSLPSVSSMDIHSSGSYPVLIPKSTVGHIEPDITQDEPTKTDTLFAKSYGRSLMASYCDTYRSDFVLMGLSTLPPTAIIEKDLSSTLEQFTLTDAVSQASCLVIDTNQLKCRVLNHRLSSTTKTEWKEINMSNLVHDLLEEIKDAYSAQGIQCVEHLFDIIEDRLQLIYLYSTMLQEIVQQDATSVQDLEKLATALTLNKSDMPLLLNVCGTFDSKLWELQRTIDQ